LTIRGLGSAAAPVGFGSLFGAVPPAQVDALLFKDSHGTCRLDCFTVTTVDGRVPQPSITFDNVHWRQNGTATQLIRPSGVLASLTVTRSTFFGTVNFESGVVRNITVQHCTMYGGLRARNMTFLHFSDVRFLLDGFATTAQYFVVVDTYDTNDMTLLFENVFATAKGTRGFQLVSLFRDTNSTAVVRNVTADSCRGIVTYQQATTPLRQLVLENVRATNTVFLLFSVGTRTITCQRRD
jgi:hypothetical protein